jgi:unspecific monooxygenase
MDVRQILGFDPTDPAFLADPYARYRRLAADGPLQRTEAGLWLVTSHELGTKVLRDPTFGHQPPGGALPDVGRRSFLTLDPPDHTRLRRLVSKAFTARLVERLRSRVTTLVEELLADVNGETDVIAALAYPLPVTVISELLGVPARDHERFKAWSDVLARGLDPDFLLPPEEIDRRAAARGEFRGYFAELAARRREDPAEDLLSALVAIEDGGDVLSEDELLSTCVLLLVAGHETTVNLIGNGALALLRDRAQLAYFRAHPEGVAAAVEELLRYDPPVQFTVRQALEDTKLGGEVIGTGQVVLVLTGAANRDPAAFPDPDRLDLSRTGTPHLTFGHGIHFCLGAPLARLEGQVALAKLFERDVRPATNEVTYRDNIILRGLTELPVVVTPA